MRNTLKAMVVLAATMIVRQATADQCVEIRQGDTLRSLKRRSNSNVPNATVVDANLGQTWGVVRFSDADDNAHRKHFAMDKVGGSKDLKSYARRYGARRGWTLTNTKFGLRHDRGPSACVTLAIPENPCLAPMAQCTGAVRELQARKGVAPSQPSAQIATVTVERDTAIRERDEAKAQMASLQVQLASKPTAVPPIAQDSGQREAEQERRLRERAEERANKAEARLAAIAVEVKPLAPRLIARLDPAEVAWHVIDLQDKAIAAQHRLAQAEQARKQAEADARKLDAKNRELQTEIAKLKMAAATAQTPGFPWWALVVALLGGAVLSGAIAGGYSRRPVPARKNGAVITAAYRMVAEARLYLRGDATLSPPPGSAPGTEKTELSAADGTVSESGFTASLEKLIDEAKALKLTMLEARVTLYRLLGTMEFDLPVSREGEEGRRAWVPFVDPMEQCSLPDLLERLGSIAPALCEAATHGARIDPTELQRRYGAVRAQVVRLTNALSLIQRQTDAEARRLQAMEPIATADPPVFARTALGIVDGLADSARRITEELPAVVFDGSAAPS